jgi:thioredoxin reductase
MRGRADPVVVVGGGPAGLACALELRRRGGADVIVLEREAAAGGIPRHCRHQGFGARDLHRVLSGPRYAERYRELARRAGAHVATEATVTGWSADGELEVTSPAGRETLRPSGVVLATGCRERPRAARLVPGSRPEGVLTTGTLQQLVELRRAQVGTRALVVGAEHVSFSALLTLAHARVDVVGMTTELPRHQTLALVRLGAALKYRVPLWTRTAVAAIHGRERVEEVELADLDTRRSRLVACDTVVFTADWVPDNELAVLAGLELDGGTRGPSVDAGLRTALPGIFAAGNLLHGAEPADVAALSGRHAVDAVTRWLANETWPSARVPLVCRPPLRWISPNAISDPHDEPPRGHFLLRSSEFLSRPVVELCQQERVLWREPLDRMVPGRSSLLPSGWIRWVDFSGLPVEIQARD